MTSHPDEGRFKESLPPNASEPEFKIGERVEWDWEGKVYGGVFKGRGATGVLVRLDGYDFDAPLFSECVKTLRRPSPPREEIPDTLPAGTRFRIMAGGGLFEFPGGAVLKGDEWRGRIVSILENGERVDRSAAWTIRDIQIVKADAARMLNAPGSAGSCGRASCEHKHPCARCGKLAARAGDVCNECSSLLGWSPASKTEPGRCSHPRGPFANGLCKVCGELIGVPGPKVYGIPASSTTDRIAALRAEYAAGREDPYVTHVNNVPDGAIAAVMADVDERYRKRSPRATAAAPPPPARHVWECDEGADSEGRVS